MSNFAEQRFRVAKIMRKMCKSEDSLLRCCAITGIRRLKLEETESIDLLMGLLNDPDPDVRVDATHAVGELRAESAVEVLLDSMRRDPVGEVRIQAATSLGSIRSSKALPGLLHCIENDGYPELYFPEDDMEFNSCWEVQSQSLKALARIGDKSALDPLVRFLNSSDYGDLQEAGLRVLISLDSDFALSYLSTRLRAEDGAVRRSATRTLSALDELSDSIDGLPKSLVIALNRAVEDEEPTVRLDAATALSRFGKAPASLSLCRLLLDPNQEIRRHAAELLSEMDRPEIVECLHEMLDITGGEIQELASRILGQIGNAESAEKLTPLLRTSDSSLLTVVIRSIGNLGSSHALRQVLELLDKSEDSELQLLLILALGNMLPVQGDAKTLELIHSNDHDSQEAEHPGMPDLEKLLESLTANDNQQVSLAAMDVYTRLYPDSGHQWLLNLLHNEDQTPEDGALESEMNSEALNLIPTRNIDQISQEEVTAATPQPTENSSEGDSKKTIIEEEEITVAEFMKELPEGGDPRKSTLASIFSENIPQEQTANPVEVSGEYELHGLDQNGNQEWKKLHAIRLLGGSQSNKEAVSKLIELGFQSDGPILNEIVRSLARLCSDAAIPLLKQSLKNKDTEIKLNTIEALLKIDEESLSKEDYTQFLQDVDPSIRKRAVQLLSGSDSDCHDVLVHAIGDDDRGVRLAALEAMSIENYDDDLREEILLSLTDKVGEDANEIGMLFKKLGDHVATDQIVEKLRDSGNHEYHWIFLNTLVGMYEDVA